MGAKFRNKYRSESIQLQQWDYRWPGAYFITICTQDREHYFGEIANGKMDLSPIGAIADILWYEIKNRAKNVELGAFVVMPNHIHGILILHGDGLETIDEDDRIDKIVDSGHAPYQPEKPPIGKTDFKISGKIRFHPLLAPINRR